MTAITYTLHTHRYAWLLRNITTGMRVEKSREEEEKTESKRINLIFDAHSKIKMQTTKTCC